MTWLNCQTARVMPDHPLAAATKPVIGCVYVQASTGGQRLGPLVGVAEKPGGKKHQPFVDGIGSYLPFNGWLGLGTRSELGVGSVDQRLVGHPPYPETRRHRPGERPDQITACLPHSVDDPRRAGT